MTDSKFALTNEVKIKHKAFGYTIRHDDGALQELIAYRGQTVKVNDADFARGSRHGAFYTKDEQKAEAKGGDGEVPGPEADLDTLVGWIEEAKPTVQQVVDASNGDVIRAKMLLDAENAATGNDPRKGVVEGLTAVIQRNNE